MWEPFGGVTILGGCNQANFAEAVRIWGVGVLLEGGGGKSHLEDFGGFHREGGWDSPAQRGRRTTKNQRGTYGDGPGWAQRTWEAQQRINEDRTKFQLAQSYLEQGFLTTAPAFHATMTGVSDD